ncbi:MAG: Zn-dependent oligopeptidase [Bacteroidales bacterium]|nr:Zn-dependent oligopeptidase [Bacteroidales bacterium]
MKTFRFLLISLIMMGMTNYNNIIAGSRNPLLFEINEVVRFNELKPEHVKEATEEIIRQTKESIAKISEIKASERNFDNTMRAFDLAYHKFSNVSNTLYLMAYTHPDSAVRDQCLASVDMLSRFDNEITLNEDLYRATHEYSQTSEAKKLTGFKKKYLDDRMRFYALNGFNLSKEKREELKKIFDKITSLGLEFSANIASVKDVLELDETEMDGLPKEYKDQHRTESGKYVIDLSYPSIVPFFQMATNENARKKLFMLYLNRAADKNLDLLNRLLLERKKAANLLGFSTAAEYIIADNMAKTPQKVWEFENSLLEKVKPKVNIDYAELIEVKRKYTNDPNANTINEWEYRFYLNKLLKEKYEVDNQKLREYFEVNNVINGILEICKQLYGVSFVEKTEAPVWHSDVKMFEMISNSKVIARIYLDLYPRNDKYKHFACFGLINGVKIGKNYQIPTAALVCNFPRPTENMPGLLTHDDVVTFFHEFGHMMHFVFSQAELAGQSGISNVHEFVEVPSQFFENWAWNYEALTLFARHYKTGEVLPKELFEKMYAARNVCSGIDANKQIFYGMLDMTYHDKFDPESNISTTEILADLQNRIGVFKYTEGTHMQASFDHLVGYAAGYYGYMWSKVYAEDLFSVFEKEGVMNKKTGLRFKKEILSKGSTEDENLIIRNFLRREPNQDAFLRSLGIDPQN